MTADLRARIQRMEQELESLRRDVHALENNPPAPKRSAGKLTCPKCHTRGVVMPDAVTKPEIWCGNCGVWSPAGKWRPWFRENFVGPCAHGSDPYERCDDCEWLTPDEAQVMALLAERDKLQSELTALEMHHSREHALRVRAETDEAKLRAALEFEVVERSALRSWCAKCRTESLWDTPIRQPHPHAASCPLARTEIP